jgi:long-chain fatty acid transport protein
MLAVMVMLLIATPAMATGAGGWRLEVGDTEAYSKGGAFAGEADNPGAVFYNPAGLTQLKGTDMTVGVAVVQPKADATATSGTEAKMERDTFYIPNFYLVSDLGLEKAAFGFGFTSFWGLTTDWPTDGFMRYVSTKSVIQSKDYMLTGAYKVTDQLSMALGLDIDASMVDLQKKLMQLGDADGNFRLKGTHNGFGGRIAGLYKLNDKHQFGLMYRTQTRHKYAGTVMLDELNAGGSNYAAIFGGASFQTEVTSKLRLPQSVVVGYSYKPTAKWIFNVDAEWTEWSSYKRFEVAYPSLNDTNDPTGLQRAVLNGGNPAPKDYDDVIAVALGAEYAMSDRLRLRGGFYYHENPVPASTWSPMLPDADSHAFTAGFGYDIKKNLTFDFAYGAMFYNTRNVDNTVGDASGGGIDGEYKQFSNLAFASVTYNF